MIDKNEFKDILRELIQQEMDQQPRFRIGTVNGYTDEGKLLILFAGEETPSEKGYSYLASYSPSTGDRVLLVRVKGTHVILDRIVTQGSVG